MSAEPRFTGTRALQAALLAAGVALAGAAAPGARAGEVLHGLSAAWSETALESGLEVTPSLGAPGSPVTLRARGLVPGEIVILGVGPDHSEWSELSRAEVGPDGRLSAILLVPGGFAPGQALIFALEPRHGETLLSDHFEVTAPGPADDEPEDPGGYVIGSSVVFD